MVSLCDEGLGVKKGYSRFMKALIFFYINSSDSRLAVLSPSIASRHFFHSHDEKRPSLDLTRSDRISVDTQKWCRSCGVEAE